MPMSIKVMLKNGFDFTIKCEKFMLNKNLLDIPTGYEIDGITQNKPIYINFNEVAAIIRTLSDEEEV